MIALDPPRPPFCIVIYFIPFPVVSVVSSFFPSAFSFVAASQLLVIFPPRLVAVRHSCLSSPWRKLLLGGAFTTASASPTCRRSVTSRRAGSLSLLRMARSDRGREDDDDGVAVDDDEVAEEEGECLAWAVLNCYWRGSEEEERRLRWR